MGEPTGNRTGEGLRPGSRFGHYRLRRLLGAGGFGEVYEAEDTVMDRVVAIKLLAAPYSMNQTFRQRLFREARAAGRLHEPHVVPIHQCGEIDGQLYIDMRFIQGTDLHAVLAKRGPLSPARAVAITRQIASALDAAHADQMIHRDVKPANILLTDDDFACLVDFGIASAATDARLTTTGTTIGTFAYIAPERLKNGDVTLRADIYALACVLYECLTGSPPYATADLPSLITAHLTAPIPRPSEQRSQIPAAFDEVIALGMAKDPKDRYASAGELARAAHRALSTQDQNRTNTIVDRTDAAPTHDHERTRPAPRPQPVAKLHQPSPKAKAATSPRPPAGSPAGKGAAGFLQRPGRRRGITLSTLAALGVVTVVITAIIGYHSPETPASPASPASSTRRPVELPLSRQGPAVSVAVDTANNVYVAEDSIHGAILKLAAGSTTVTELPAFGSDARPSGVAVDAAGDIFVADCKTETVLELPAGSDKWNALPFTGLNGSVTNAGLAIAADAGGTIYVTDAGNRRVLKLAAGSNTPVELPFTALSNPSGVAVDAAGGVYVSDAGSSDVYELPLGAGGPPARLPFEHLNGPVGVAVDNLGTVYVGDSGNGVVELPRTPGSQTSLPFDGLMILNSLAVDTAGNVFVTDGNGRVLKLPAS
jgi:serine/threonine-protein kinase